MANSELQSSINKVTVAAKKPGQVSASQRQANRDMSNSANRKFVSHPVMFKPGLQKTQSFPDDKLKSVSMPIYYPRRSHNK